MSTQRDAYTAFQEGTRLLEGGNVHAAVISLEEARALEPSKGSVREALARAPTSAAAGIPPRSPSSRPRSRSTP